MLGFVIGVMLTAAVAAFAAESPIKIVLDGREINTDVPPQIIGGRTLVPIRVISEAIGMGVRWDAAARTVYLTSPENMPAFGVLSYNKIDTDYGYVILGEVKNQSKKTYGKVEIKANVLDSGGNVFDTLSATLPPGITPGETAYFRLRSLTGNSNRFNDVNFSFTTSGECTVTPTDVAFSDVRFSRDSNLYSDFIYVTGNIERLEGDLNRKYNHPVVQIALYDKTGKMVNYGEKSLDDYGNARYGEFKITLDKGPDYASYKLKCFSD